MGTHQMDVNCTVSNLKRKREPSSKNCCIMQLLHKSQLHISSLSNPSKTPSPPWSSQWEELCISTYASCRITLCLIASLWHKQIPCIMVFQLSWAIVPCTIDSQLWCGYLATSFDDEPYPNLEDRILAWYSYRVRVPYQFLRSVSLVDDHVHQPDT